MLDYEQSQGKRKGDKTDYIMSEGLKSYMCILELMKDEEKFNGLLNDIARYFNDHYEEKNYFED